MENQKPARRLAAIFAADVVGYSRLMGSAEEYTLSRLKTLRESITDPKIAEHRGRIFKSTGDGLLAEFGSALDAIRCASDIQNAVAMGGSGIPQDEQLVLRIGIHIGDIIIDDGDVFGDGVNIAARLESIAPPGGLCISDDTYRQIRKNIDLPFADLGPQTLKNMSEPIRAWQTLFDIQTERLNSRDVAPPNLPTGLERPSIAVLPFSNLSSDPEQEFFVDGITEDIITELSRIRGLLVIARNSTFTYKGRAVDIKKVAAELGVKYVLEGSVRKVGNRIRITAQLIEASKGSHAWAERYDRDVTDIFDLQDEITRSIVATLQTEIILLEGSLAERSEFPGIELWSTAKKTWRLFYALTQASLLEGRNLAKQMTVNAPNHPEGYRLFSLITSHYIFMGFAQRPTEMKAEAVEAIQKAIDLKEDDEHTHWGIGIISSFLDEDYGRAETAYQRAIEINPNFSLGYGSYGAMLAYAGRGQESIDKTLYAMRLNPKDPSIFFRFSSLAIAHFLLANLDEARKWAQLSIERKPDWWIGHAVTIASLVLMGREAEAKSAGAEFVRRFPNITLQSLPIEPIRPASFKSQFHSALEKAGVPAR